MLAVRSGLPDVGVEVDTRREVAGVRPRVRVVGSRLLRVAEGEVEVATLCRLAPLSDGERAPFWEEVVTCWLWTAVVARGSVVAVPSVVSEPFVDDAEPETMRPEWYSEEKLIRLVARSGMPFLPSSHSTAPVGLAASCDCVGGDSHPFPLSCLELRRDMLLPGYRLAGLAGGGMEILARSTLPELVSVSACLPFREEEEALESGWETDSLEVVRESCWSGAEAMAGCVCCMNQCIELTVVYASVH